MLFRFTILVLMAAIGIATWGFGPAPRGWEGTVVYKVTFTGAAAEMMQSMMPQNITTAFKGKKAVSVIKGVPNMGDVIMLMDYETGYSYLVDHLNRKIQKFKIDQGPDTSGVVVKPAEGTATILGYACRHYTATMKEETLGDVVMHFWTTDRIVPQSVDGRSLLASNTRGLQGFPLKITTDMSAMGVVMTYLATEVRENTVDESVFVLPSGYAVEEVDTGLGRRGGMFGF